MQPVKAMPSKIIGKNFVKIPAVILEEQSLQHGSPLTIMYGKNCTVMIVVPADTKLSNTMQERISILINETKLD